MSKEAMKLALEALETAWTYDEDNADGYYLEAITALRKALAEQPAQQEPVARFIRFGKKGTSSEGCTVEFLGEKPLPPDGSLFYTTPQPPAQRTWVGLSDEKIARVVSLAGFAPDWVEAHIAIQIVRVLEAELKEKNT